MIHGTSVVCDSGWKGRMTEDLSDLVGRAKGGDPGAEEQLFAGRLRRFEAFTARRVPGEAARDVAQEACITVLKKYRAESFTVGFDAWAYGVLKNTIRNHRRGARVREAVITEGTDPGREEATGPPPPDAELRLTLLDCLRKIFRVNPRYARVINLAHQGLRTGEICGRLRVKPNHYYVLLNRSRSMLKLCLETGRV